MRILMMLDWNRGQGGAEAYASLLRDGLRAAGDEVRLLTSSAGTAGDGTADYIAFGTDRKAAQAFLQLVNPLAVATVRRAVREFRPDVAWVNMFSLQLSPAALLALGNLPTVLAVSDYKLTCPVGSKLMPDGSLCAVPAGWVCCAKGCLSAPHWLRDQLRYALIRGAVRRAAKVMACSTWVRDQLADAGIQSEVAMLPVAPASGCVRRPASAPTFLFCGRLDREKGVDHLLRAFARLHAEWPEAQLRIAGRGIERERLERLAGSLGIEHAVRFLGWLPFEQIEQHLAEAWASVVPSVWAEPQGMVVAEAIIRGVPVIASAAGGLAEVVEHGRNGLLFPRADEGALLDCLRAVVSGSVFPDHTLGAEAVASAVERFSIERHVRRMRGVFDEAARREESSQMRPRCRSSARRSTE